MIDEAIPYARRKQKSIDDFKLLEVLTSVVGLVNDEATYIVLRDSLAEAKRVCKISYKDVESK